MEERDQITKSISGNRLRRAGLILGLIGAGAGIPLSFVSCLEAGSHCPLSTLCKFYGTSVVYYLESISHLFVTSVSGLTSLLAPTMLN